MDLLSDRYLFQNDVASWRLSIGFRRLQQQDCILLRCMRTIQIMLITVLLVAKNVVLQGYPIREPRVKPGSHICKNYEYTWALL